MGGRFYAKWGMSFFLFLGFEILFRLCNSLSGVCDLQGVEFMFAGGKKLKIFPKFYVLIVIAY